MFSNVLPIPVQRMLQDQKTVGSGPITAAHGNNKNFQFTLDSDTNGATATAQVWATNRADGQDMVQIGSDVALATGAGASHYANGLLDTNVWGYYQVRVTAIAGTNARVNCWLASV